MPIYEYYCEKCGEKFELLRSMVDSDKDTKCPKCGEKSAKKIFSTFGVMSPGTSCTPSAPGCST